MVKLIASDIDGTLIPYGGSAVEPELFDLIRQLRRLDILFCPASGRQFHSLRQLFAPVAEEICFLCENGAILYGPGIEERAPVLAKTVMPRRESLALAEDILNLEGCQVLISGANTGYVCTDRNGFIHYLREDRNNNIRLLSTPEAITEDILKVSAYCPAGTAGPLAALGPRWGEALHMAAAGPDWVDFTLADKGHGLEQLCAALGIAARDAMAFGDNWNDEAMLRTAGTPYLMDTADAALRERFPRQCSSVAAVLRSLLDNGI